MKRIPPARPLVCRTTLPRPDRLRRGHPISVQWDRPPITRETDLSASSQSADRPPATPRRGRPSHLWTAGPSHRLRLSWPHPFHVKRILGPKSPVRRPTSPCATLAPHLGAEPPALVDNVKRISRAGSQSADRLHRHPTPRATFPSLVCRPEPPPSALVAPRVSRETDPPAGDPQSADGRRRDPTGSTEATPISVQWAPHPSHVKRIPQRAPCPPTALPPTALPPPDAAGDLRVSVCRPEPPPSTLASPPVSRETDPPPGPRLPNDLTPTRPAPPRPPRSRFTGTTHPSHVKRISQRAPSPPTAFTATPRPSHLWSVGPATAFGSRGQREADLPGGLPVRRPPSRHPTPQATFPSLVCRPEPPPSALVPPPLFT